MIRVGILQKAAAAQTALVVLLLGTALVAPVQAKTVRLEGGALEQVRLGAGLGGVPYGTRYGEERRGFSQERLARLQDRIDWAFDRGALNRREASRLQRRAEDLDDLARFYWRSRGIDWREREDLDRRFDDLRNDVRYQIWERDYRGNYEREWRDRGAWNDDDWARSRKEARVDRHDERAPGYGLRGRSGGVDDDQRQDNRYPDNGNRSGGNSSAQGNTSDQQDRSTRTTTPSAGDDQPFKDGRDFH